MSESLRQIAHQLVSPGRGILAADESTGTIGKRFASIGVESTEELRRCWRQLLFTTPGIEKAISGAILYDETLRQSASGGAPFPELLTKRDVLPGIKVDTGARALAGAPGEKVTEGLDGLRERLAEYRSLGARFAKWRAVITIGDGLPSDYCIDANAHALARYAALCVEQGLVPIVEPEVLMDGGHSIEVCEDVTFKAHRRVFTALAEQRVPLEEILLKPNMVVSGKAAGARAGVEEVAASTLRCLRRGVPAAVTGIVFLSGGQSETEATAHLQAMNAQAKAAGGMPWELSFSYGRALQASALQAWAGKEANVGAAQRCFRIRASMNGAAAAGQYDPKMESQTTIT